MSNKFDIIVPDNYIDIIVPIKKNLKRSLVFGLEARPPIAIFLSYYGYRN